MKVRVEWNPLGIELETALVNENKLHHKRP